MIARWHQFIPGPNRNIMQGLWSLSIQKDETATVTVPASASPEELRAVMLAARKTALINLLNKVMDDLANDLIELEDEDESTVTLTASPPPPSDSYTFTGGLLNNPFSTSSWDTPTSSTSGWRTMQVPIQFTPVNPTPNPAPTSEFPSSPSQSTFTSLTDHEIEDRIISYLRPRGGRLATTTHNESNEPNEA